MQKLFRLFVIALIMTTVGCNISGTVKDNEGNPVEGAVVTLNTGAEATTNADGVYGFSGLAPGSYSVSAVYGDMDFVYETLFVNLSFKNGTANFVEYLPREPASYNLEQCNGGYFYYVSIYSSQFDVTIYMDARITQTVDPDSIYNESLFTLEVTNVYNEEFTGIIGSIFKGEINGDEYVAKTLPGTLITVVAGSVSGQIKFTGLKFTADNCSFTGTASAVALKSGFAIGSDILTISTAN